MINDSNDVNLKKILSISVTPSICRYCKKIFNVLLLPRVYYILSGMCCVYYVYLFSSNIKRIYTLRNKYTYKKKIKYGFLTPNRNHRDKFCHAETDAVRHSNIPIVILFTNISINVFFPFFLTFLFYRKIIRKTTFVYNFD